MFIQQIIKFELKGPGPLVVQAVPKLIIFMAKQIYLRKIFE